MNSSGAALLTDGPGGRGLDFNNDGDFTGTGAIGQNNNYANLFIGYFTPQETGVHGFRRNQDDDRCGIWLDLENPYPLDRITDVVLTQGPLLRSCDIWTLNVQTAGAGAQVVAEARLIGLENPEVVRDQLLKARDAARQGNA